MTQKIKSNRLLIKRWNFSKMSIFRAQNSVSWSRVITNDAVLSLEHKKHGIPLISLKGSLKAKNRSNLTPIIPILLCLQTQTKLCSYILYKNFSPRNTSKLPPGRV